MPGYTEQSLRDGVTRSLTMVERQLDEIKVVAQELEVSPYSIRDANGGWVMIPLLAARVQGLHALTLLNKKDI